MTKEVLLRPIKITTEDFEAIEEKIKALFKIKIYEPLLRELSLPRKTLTNSLEDLLKSLQEGRITFSRGSFAGRFNSSITKELRELGARFDRKTGAFKLPLSSLPLEVRSAISASEWRFKQKIDRIDRKLAQILPEEIAGRLSISKNFDRTLWKTDRDFKSSVKGITVAPELTESRRKKIADEWQNNMRLWIKEFTEKEIVELRKNMKATVFAGNRYESAVKTIQKSYGVSANKAKFLARQETSLLMTKFKETRYLEAGVNEYKWGAVSGTPAHPVRPRHKALAEASNKGKIYRWDNPPITSEPGQPDRRNNPGQDYNCRCFPKPVVRFKV